ncbi:flagellar hook-basal body complex protein FliE [Paenibacillus abyssi]|uniref:Flagellar hook-basal body complex protein FliE n=1 Tax=Paenibacillus abyssi TaxID=1340531 RepID=A0A917D855_9BACL|nr:flagellar hook-basal body complex protein FliE [Paenibacillus abyssi]GGG12432.1 hypothetical protein GCM10010916_31640 [Paenibacillus abyssi]
MITNVTVGAGQPSRLIESAAGQAVTPSEVTKSFGEFLKTAIDGVNEQEHAVSKVTDRFILGQADVSEVMITAEQAQLSLQLTSQVRNKVIEAYHEIMRMQL